MRDTSTRVKTIYHDMLMARSPEERLKMGCSMFDAAKQIVRSSILNKDQNISDQELKKKIFLRFYGHEFTPQKLKKILSSLV